MDQAFDNGLRASTYDLATSTVNVMAKDYEYNNDGSLKFVDDNLNWKFDRSYTYDHQTRLKDGKSSTEATGTEITNGGDQIANLPYRQSHTFNAFGNMTARNNKQWGGDTNSSYSITNDRISDYGWSYDADGRVTSSPYPDISTITYDAAGRISEKHDKAEPTVHEDKITRYYDGDGRETKRVTDRCRIILPEDPEDPCTWQGGELKYFIRSTVLGGEVIIDTGVYGKRNIYAFGRKFGELTYRLEWPGIYGVPMTLFSTTTMMPPMSASGSRDIIQKPC
jgi:YD repeat-containing protein